MYKIILLFAALAVFAGCTNRNNPNESLLRDLDTAIEQREHWDALKREHIALLRKNLNTKSVKHVAFVV